MLLKACEKCCNMYVALAGLSIDWRSKRNLLLFWECQLSHRLSILIQRSFNIQMMIIQCLGRFPLRCHLNSYLVPLPTVFPFCYYSVRWQYAWFHSISIFAIASANWMMMNVTGFFLTPMLRANRKLYLFHVSFFNASTCLEFQFNFACHSISSESLWYKTLADAELIPYPIR